jgi:type II secretory pathway predicted ATPase ExeA
MPFSLTADERFLFLTSRHREALSNLRYGLSTPRGLTLLIGDAGMGKTTLVRAAISSGDSRDRYVLISNPTLTRAEFYDHLVRDFGLSDEASSSKTTFLSELQANIEQRSAAGGLTGLIIDEAQSVPYELLEEIRLLGNIETPSEKLLNIVLAGQPELADRLNESSLRQLKQRITLRCELTSLNLNETCSYIAGRIRIAGGAPEDVFSREAVIAIHHAAAGNPRTVNVICDNALLNGFAEQKKPIPSRLVEDVCRDFDLHASQSSPASVSQESPGARIVEASDQSEAPASQTRTGEEGSQLRAVKPTRKRFSFF